MNNDYEVEIDLKGLIFTIFYRWRPIIIVAVVFGVLAGGYKIGSGLIKQQDKEYISELQEKYDDDVIRYKKNLISYDREIQNIKANLESQEKYVEESILVNINPYDKWTSTVDVFVTMADEEGLQGVRFLPVDYTDSVVKAYVSAIQRGDCLNGLSQKLNMDASFIKELVNVDMDYNSNMLNIAVSYTDKAGAEEILDTILNSVKNMKPEVESALGDHAISIMNQNVSSATDQNLAIKQKQTMDGIMDLQDSLNEKEKELNDLEEPDTPESLSKKALLKSCIKSGVIGGVLGAFLTILCICIVFLVGNKVNTANELKNRYRLKLLGVFEQPIRKRALSRIDNWLARLEGRTGNSEDFVYNMLMINTKNYLGDNKKVLVTGTVVDEVLQAVAAKLNNGISEAEFTVGSDMNKTADTLKKLPNYDSIIIVEECGTSNYGEIQREIETINNLNKQVLGCIVF